MGRIADRGRIRRRLVSAEFRPPSQPSRRSLVRTTELNSSRSPGPTANDLRRPEGAAMAAPARVGVVPRPSPAPALLHFRSDQDRGSLLWQMTPVLGVLADRYPDVSDEVIRQQAIEVLCAAQGNRVNAAL